jgi:hypothetical protein
MAGSLSPRIKGAVAAVRQWAASPLARRLKLLASIGLSAGILWLLVRTLADVPAGDRNAALAAGLPSWGLFILSYALQPMFDWQMFRGWWRLRAVDIGAFLRRRVLNEAVVSYAGDAWFSVWAAKRLNFDMASEAREMAGRGMGRGRTPRGSPLAAIKDAAVTSSLAGNLFVLINLAAMLALGGAVYLMHAIEPAMIERIGLGFLVLLGISIIVLTNRTRVFSLAVRYNLFSFSLHLARTLACHVALLASWALAVPGIAPGNWAMLGAVRLVITRLPLPNKEVLFAALASRLADGQSDAIAALMAVQGAAWLCCHAVAWGIALALPRAMPMRPD